MAVQFSWLKAADISAWRSMFRVHRKKDSVSFQQGVYGIFFYAGAMNMGRREKIFRMRLESNLKSLCKS